MKLGLVRRPSHIPAEEYGSEAQRTREKICLSVTFIDHPWTTSVENMAAISELHITHFEQ